jgi:hypothetical protein
MTALAHPEPSVSASPRLSFRARPQASGRGRRSRLTSAALSKLGLRSRVWRSSWPTESGMLRSDRQRPGTCPRAGGLNTPKPRALTVLG